MAFNWLLGCDGFFYLLFGFCLGFLPTTNREAYHQQQQQQQQQQYHTMSSYSQDDQIDGPMTVKHLKLKY